MRKLPFARCFWERYPHTLKGYGWLEPPVQDLELELLRRILMKLESLSDFCEEPHEQGDMLELYSLLRLLEVSKRQASAREVSVDWARLLPLLLAVGVVLGVIIAELLGLDMRRAF